MNRFAPAASVLLLCLGVVLVLGVRPAPLAATTPTAIAAATTLPPPTSSVAATASPSATPVPAIPPGYRVKIPRLAIDLPITEGDVERDTVRQETPNNFAFHFPGTALPGDVGNTYIYAHARQGMFLALWNAHDGDQIVIVTPNGRELRYVVREVHPRIEPTDVSWTQPTAAERLTLQTSTGPNPGDPRFVVIALPG